MLTFHQSKIPTRFFFLQHQHHHCRRYHDHLTIIGKSDSIKLLNLTDEVKRDTTYLDAYTYLSYIHHICSIYRQIYKRCISTWENRTNRENKCDGIRNEKELELLAYSKFDENEKEMMKVQHKTLQEFTSRSFYFFMTHELHERANK